MTSLGGASFAIGTAVSPCEQPATRNAAISAAEPTRIIMTA